MKSFKNIIILILVLLITYETNAQSDIYETYGERKAKYYSKLSNFDESKYNSKSSFSYDINYYRLEFEIDPAVKAIKGKVTTYFEVKDDNFSSIAFDLNHVGLITDSVIYHSSKLTNFTHTNYELSIDFPSAIGISVLDSVSVYYHGIPDASGLGSFVQALHDGHPIIWTLSEPYGARDWWPCKQSLNDKADSIDVFITNPDSYYAASSGILVSETENGGFRTAHWKHKYPITAYLVAIAVTNYSIYSSTITLNSGSVIDYVNYVFPENRTYAENNTPNLVDVMQLYSDLFIDYPFKDEKYGHAEFGWGGGMEHQTMSFMGSFSHGLMAHELAHQWFGDYITCGTWEDIWLNEGFATYLDGMTHEHNLNDDGVSFDQWKAWRIGYITTEPDGSVFVDDTTSDGRIFSGRLSYSKGALVLHMLRKKIGDDNFFTGIQNYLNDPELANAYAYTEDLQYHLEQSCACSLEEFLDDWIYGEGYPIYDIVYVQTPEGEVNVSVSQDQSHSSVSFFEMDVPILFEGVSKDSLVIFNNVTNGESFSFTPSFEIVSARFDPHSDIISAGSSVFKVDPFNGEENSYLAPNPVRNTLKITFKEKIMPEMIKITDLNGKELKSFERASFPSYVFEFDVSDLSTGIYIFKIEDTGEIVSKKFVKY